MYNKEDTGKRILKKARNGMWVASAVMGLAIGAINLGTVEVQASEIKVDNTETVERHHSEADLSSWTANSTLDIQTEGMKQKDETEQDPFTLYTIKWGDTLSHIAEAFNSTVNTLVDINGIENPDLIYAGDTLKLEDGTEVKLESEGKESASTSEDIDSTEASGSGKQESTEQGSGSSTVKGDSGSGDKGSSTEEGNKGSSGGSSEDVDTNDKGNTGDTGNTGDADGKGDNDSEGDVGNDGSGGSGEVEDNENNESEGDESEGDESEGDNEDDESEDDNEDDESEDDKDDNEDDKDDNEDDESEDDKDDNEDDKDDNEDDKDEEREEDEVIEEEVESGTEEVEPGKPEIPEDVEEVEDEDNATTEEGDTETEVEETPEGEEIVKETKEETTYIPIKRGVQYLEDPTLAKGEEVVEQEGKDGVREVVTKYYYEDGVLVNEEKVSDIVTQKAITKVVRVGTKVDEIKIKKDKVKVTTNHATVYEETDTLYEGETEVVRDEKPTIEYKHYETTIINGVEQDDRTLVKTELDQEGHGKKVLVGTKKRPVITTDEKTETETIEYTTIEEKTDKLYVGETEVKRAGKDGKRTVVYEITYTDGVETDRKVVSDKTVKAVDEIILVGTKEKPVYSDSVEYFLNKSQAEIDSKVGLDLYDDIMAEAMETGDFEEYNHMVNLDGKDMQDLFNAVDKDKVAQELDKLIQGHRQDNGVGNLPVSDKYAKEGQQLADIYAEYGQGAVYGDLPNGQRIEDIIPFEKKAIAYDTKMEFSNNVYQLLSPEYLAKQLFEGLRGNPLEDITDKSGTSLTYRFDFGVHVKGNLTDLNNEVWASFIVEYED